MPEYLASTFATTAILFVALAVMLAIGMQPRLSRHTRGVHVAAVALIWLGAACMHTFAGAAVPAYLITLAAIFAYRHTMHSPSSGWYRLGAGITAVWIVLGLLFLAAEHDGKQPTAEGYAFGGWIFAVLGMLPWLLGWLAQWIRQGFSSRNALA